MELLNLIWFITFGWWQAIVCLILAALFAFTIIGIPIAKSLLQFAKLSAFPFGKEIIKENKIKTKNISNIKRIGSIIINIIWFPIGLIFASIYIIIGLVSCVTIVGIPFGIVFIRSSKFVIWPIGSKVVSKKEAYALALANEIESRRNSISVL